MSRLAQPTDSREGCHHSSLSIRRAAVDSHNRRRELRLASQPSRLWMRDCPIAISATLDRRAGRDIGSALVLLSRFLSERINDAWVHRLQRVQDGSQCRFVYILKNSANPPRYTPTSNQVRGTRSRFATSDRAFVYIVGGSTAVAIVLLQFSPRVLAKVVHHSSRRIQAIDGGPQRADLGLPSALS